MSVYDEILSSSNIVNILEYYGLKVNRNKCTCPFHNDKNPSMSIHQNKGIAKCFACGAGGNSISFIQKYESEINHNQISIKEAMQKAIDIQGLNIVIPNIYSHPFHHHKIVLQCHHNSLQFSYTCMNIHFLPNDLALPLLQ